MRSRHFRMRRSRFFPKVPLPFARFVPCLAPALRRSMEMLYAEQIADDLTRNKAHIFRLIPRIPPCRARYCPTAHTSSCDQCPLSSTTILPAYMLVRI
ncbi:hypothetical protein BD310DRAFT_661549 [Dichomitus squalens]|uniref:Uncharacterized protein n=1 Tax=Dichomitus squalens TaxID=114155 RepID=A0A4Q9Q7L5_9APHY|nr:hypothetical protein BD310DRAFT_661549 [Dichomitus squalens]